MPISIDHHYQRLFGAISAVLFGGVLPLCAAATVSCQSSQPDHRCHPQDETQTTLVYGRMCSPQDSRDPNNPPSPPAPKNEEGLSPCFASCEEACRGHGWGGYVECTASASQQGPKAMGGPNANARAAAAKSSDAGGDPIQCTFHMMHACGRGFAELIEPFTPSSRDDVADSGGDVASFFARSAWMEAASIASFRRLARELKFHDAPMTLVRAARMAARDEARHTRVMRTLALAFGASLEEIPRVLHRPFASHRSLEAIAIENVVEACVGETYGAALAMYQAASAQDERVRLALSTIAHDELRHAALGHAIAEWISSVLPASALKLLARERDEAIARLERSLAASHPLPEVGMPRASDAQRLLRSVTA